MASSRSGSAVPPLSLDTFPKLLAENAKRFAGRPACREKEYGIWQSWTWREVSAEVRALACGLAAKGFQRGDKLAIVGDNRPRLYWSLCAAQCLGGIPVPMYQDSVVEELRFVVEHSEVRFGIAQDQEQVDKLLLIKEQVPGLETIAYLWPKGLRHYEHLFDFRDLQEAGRAYAQEHPGFF